MPTPKISGESPPPAPRACFGRDEIINEIIGLAENREPIALIGAGGIGKTSIALTVLHHNRIKQRFGENRRFIRCDQFPATHTNFLSRLSKVTGAGAENPEDLTPLLPFLSSKEILIVLDNAESILDPQGANSREIYASVEELCRMDTISLCITSRISTVPPDCETFDVPTLSMEPARDVFYRICKRLKRSDVVDEILKQLDFHPLSITLLATVAHQNKWDTKRLVEEWEGRRTGALQTEHRTSLASTIELSLASPLFKELGPDARGLLGVVAFYPQGVNEKNLSWLFPMIPEVTRIFDKFSILSLTHRNNGFVTMLAPLRDHLRPEDPNSSQLLSRTKECYFTRMSVRVDPNLPGFEDARWVVSEDVNIEHLLNVSVSADPDSSDVWGACINFMRHLEHHKPRPIALISKIEALPDSNCSKLECLCGAAVLFGAAGNYAEGTRLLNHVLKLERGRGNDDGVALTLLRLSHTNRMLGLNEEGIDQAKEALEIFERLDRMAQRAKCLELLARLFHADGQLDAAEEAAVQSIKLFPEEGQAFWVCISHRTLGDIYSSKCQGEKAIHHYGVALEIASSFNWRSHLFWIHFSLAEHFLDKDKFDDSYAHIEQAKSRVLDDPYRLGRVTDLQAVVLYRHGRLEEARSKAMHALGLYEKVGASEELRSCGASLQNIERAMDSGATFSESDSDGELLEKVSCSMPTDSPFFSTRRIVVTLIAHLVEFRLLGHNCIYPLFPSAFPIAP